MKTTRSRRREWPKTIRLGNAKVKVYRRVTASGKPGFMVTFNVDGKRKWNSFSDEAQALFHANAVVRRLSTHGTKVASISPEEISNYIQAVESLGGIPLADAVSTLKQALSIVGGDLSNVIVAARFYKAKHKTIIAMRVSDVVNELIELKEQRGASKRYLRDLGGRLRKFADAFQKNIGDVSTHEIQQWLDSAKAENGTRLSPTSYGNYRQVLHLLFSHAMARGYCAGPNPVEGVEKLKVKRGDTLIFKPDEIARLLAAARPQFLPTLAIGSFAGLRSAELERLEWSDIDLKQRFIVLASVKTKTRSRRVVPMTDNLFDWLQPFAGSKGKVWRSGWLYKEQQDCARAAGVKWKANALRHSFCSYRLAMIQDAAKVSLEAGNSPQMVFQHYNQLVTPQDAERWFAVRPQMADNVVAISSVQVRT